jgi:hypothetical protein
MFLDIAIMREGMKIYETARNKVAWADHHIAEIEARIDVLKKALTVTSHINPKTGCEFIKCDFVDTTQGAFVDELALRLGDAIHNLKCALDHAWFQTVQRLMPDGDWERPSLPVYPSPDFLEVGLKRLKIDVTTNFFKFIVSKIEPYDGGDIAIWTVHKLNNRDKHSVLIPVIHYSAIQDIYLKNQRGEIQKGSTVGTIQALPYCFGFEPGIHIENPGNATFEIMFKYGKAGKDTRMVDTLRLYSEQILTVVKLLEEFEE